MKVAFFLLALVSLSCAAPQPRKIFHEHFDDFINIILEEIGDDIEKLAEQYMEFDEFIRSIEYLTTQNFRNLVYEMEALPEFEAVSNKSLLIYL